MKYGICRIVKSGKKFIEKTIGFKLGSENPNAIMNAMKNEAKLKCRMLPAGEKQMILEALRNSETEGAQLVELNNVTFKVFTVGVLAVAGRKATPVVPAEKTEHVEVEQPQLPIVADKVKPSATNASCFHCKKPITGKFSFVKGKGTICEKCLVALTKELEEAKKDATEENDKELFIRENLATYLGRYDKLLEKACADAVIKPRELMSFELFNDSEICHICGHQIENLNDEKKVYTAVHDNKKAHVHAVCLIDKVKLDPTFQTLMEYKFYGFSLPAVLENQLLTLWAALEVKVGQSIDRKVRTAARVERTITVDGDAESLEFEGAEGIPADETETAGEEDLGAMIDRLSSKKN